MQKFVPTTKEEKNQVLKEIENIALSITKHNGKFVGEFVRDVLVPRHYDNNCDINIGKVDIWFQLYDRDRFVASTESIKSINLSNADVYQIVKFGSIIAEINVFTTFSLGYRPDYLDARYKQIGGWVFSSSKCENFPTDELMDEIKCKKLKMFPCDTYLVRKSHKDVCRGMIDRFLSKGWEIQLHPDKNKEYKYYAIKNDKITVDELINLATEVVEPVKVEKVENRDVLYSVDDIKSMLNVTNTQVTKLTDEIADIKKVLSKIQDMIASK